MKCTTMSIGELRDRYKMHQINLDPPYQRRPVWKTKDRLLLLSSLFNGIPIPAVILHKYFDKRKKREIYDLLDGKQRIETILHFIQLRALEGEKALWVDYINPQTNKKDWLTYAELSSKKVNKQYENLLENFWQYEVPVIEYGIWGIVPELEHHWRKKIWGQSYILHFTTRMSCGGVIHKKVSPALKRSARA